MFVRSGCSLLKLVFSNDGEHLPSLASRLYRHSSPLYDGNFRLQNN